MPQTHLQNYRISGWRRLSRHWPVLVWLAFVAAAFILYFETQDNIRIDGVVDIPVEAVGSHESGLIVEVPVVPGQVVRAGDVVARLDTSIIEEEITVMKETVVRRRDDTRRLYANTLLRLEADRRSLQLRLSEDTARLGVLATEVGRLEELLSQRLITADILVGTRARIAAMESAVALYPSMIAQLDRQLAETQAQIDELETDEYLTADFKANLAFLERRKEARSLRAQHDGIVAGIAHERGEVVRVGAPIVRIVIEQPARIIGFLHEAHMGRINLDQVVFLSPANDPGRVISGRVETLNPRINVVPDASSPLPNRMNRGVTMIIRPEEAYPFTPGQKIDIRLHRPGIIRRIVTALEFRNSPELTQK